MLVVVGDWAWDEDCHCDWDWDWEEGDVGDATTDRRSEMVLRYWRKGWLGWVVAGRGFSRRVADTVRHSSGSVVVRRRKETVRTNR